jgi:copper(I)-binding protein
MEVVVREAWVRASTPGQKATGAFMQLTATQDLRLIGARSSAAGVIEIHEMILDKDVMKMRPLPFGLDLPAGKNVELNPGGYHIMLMDLKEQLKEGDTMQLTLIVEGKDKKRSNIELRAPIKLLATKK